MKIISLAIDSELITVTQQKYYKLTKTTISID